ncbi:MAG: hypothetical protein R2778_11560 [Saprospiraceae bacterium]
MPTRWLLFGKWTSLIQASRDSPQKEILKKLLKLMKLLKKSLWKISLDGESVAYGDCCSNHGRVLHIKGDYAKAEARYLNSKEIRKILETNIPIMPS